MIEMYREELTGYTERYYEVLTSEKTKWFEEENFLGLGNIKLGLILGGQEMHRKVAMIRKTGIKIKDQDHMLHCMILPWPMLSVTESSIMPTPLRLKVTPCVSGLPLLNNGQFLIIQQMKTCNSKRVPKHGGCAPSPPAAMRHGKRNRCTIVSGKRAP